MLWAVFDSLEATQDMREMGQRIFRQLSRFPISRLARFQRELLDCMDELLDWRVWEAADAIHGLPCSGDVFIDFRYWVIAQGGKTFEAVLQDPDVLASHSEIRRVVGLPMPWGDSDYPHFEELGSVAGWAFEALLEKLGPAVALSVDRPDVLDEQVRAYLDHPYPGDYGVDDALHLRLPRLSALRGWLP